MYDHKEMKIYAEPSLELSQQQIRHFTLRVQDKLKKISDVLGKYISEERELLVIHLGSNNNEGKTFRYPYFDGDIHLFTNPSRQQYDFADSLTHELVHYLRTPLSNHHEKIGDWDDGFLFVEEGFAGLITHLVEPQQPSFPFWGSSPHAFVSFLLKENLYIPIKVIIENWRTLFDQCSVQQYAITISFFKFLYDTLGRDPVFKMAFSKQRVSTSSISNAINSIELMEARWLEHLKKKSSYSFPMKRYWLDWKQAFCGKTQWKAKITIDNSK